MKKKSVIGALAAVAVTGTFAEINLNKPAEPVRYVMAAVTRGSLATSISGSGQVSAEQQVDVKSKVSGTILQTMVKLGEEVTTDTPLFQIEQKDASKAVRDAEQGIRDAQISLEAAQISYDKLVRPDSNSAVTQAQNALNQAERNLEDLQKGPTALQILSAENKIRTAELNAKLTSDGTTPKVVRDAYDKIVSSLDSILVTLDNALDDSDDILGIDGSVTNLNFVPLFSVLDQGKKITAQQSYASAKNALQTTHDAIDPLALRGEDSAKVDASMDTVEAAIDATAKLLDDMQKALDASLTSSGFSQTNLDTYNSSIQSDITSVTNAYSTLSSQQDSIESARESFDNARNSLTQAEAELEDLMKGPDANDIAQAKETIEERKLALADAKGTTDDLDIKTAANVISQRKSSLQNAKDNLQDALDAFNDYTVRAPFDGVIAKLSMKTKDEASPSVVMATILTKAKIAVIPLNEVDIAKIKVGQKATLTFDAVQDLTIAGTVTEVDMIGAASQGVVTYDVKVAFLTDDERIKPSMSVSASIVTDIRTDVLLVPNAAVQQANGSATVQTLPGVALNATSMGQGVPSKTPPQLLEVTTGLANDQYTEIKTGLNEGDAIVTRTVQPTATTAAKATTSQNSILQIPSGGAGFTGSGNAVRFQR